MWRALWTDSGAPSLTVSFRNGTGEVRDTRRGDERVLLLDAASTAIYRSCFDGPAVVGRARAAAADVADEPTARDALDRLQGDGLLMRDGNLVLALALPELHATRIGAQ